MSKNENNLKLSDLIDIELLQGFQDFFSKTIGLASLTYGVNTPITNQSNFTHFCSVFVRGEKGNEDTLKNCNDFHLKWGKIAAEKNEPVIYTCPNGLTEFAVPIFVEEQHLGSIIGGQVFLEHPNEEHYREVARQNGVDENAYIEALKKIKVVSKETVETAANFLYLVANTISKVSLKNLELIKKNEREALLREIISAISSTLDFNEIKKRIITQLGVAIGSDFDILYLVDSNTGKFMTVDESSVHLSSDEIESPVGINIAEEYGWGDLFRSGEMSELFYSDVENSKKDYNLYGTKGELFLDKYKIKSNIIIPIRYLGNLIGILGMNFVKEHKTITEDDINFVKIVASQAGIAIHQAELYEEKKKIAEIEKTLREIMLASVSTFDINEVWKSIVTKAGKLLESDRCFFCEFEPMANSALQIKYYAEYTSSSNIKPITIKDPNIPEMTVLVESAKQKSILTVENVENENLPKNTKKMLIDESVKSFLRIPVYHGEIMYGALVFHYVNNYRSFRQEDIDLVQAIASQSAIIIHQAKLYNKTKQQAETEAKIREITEMIRATLDIDKTRKTIVDVVGKMLKADRCFIVDYDKESNGFLVVKDEYLSSENIIAYKGVDINKDAPAFAEILKKGKQIIINNKEIYSDDDGLSFDVEKQEIEKYNIKSAFATPYKIKSAFAFPYYNDILLGALLIHYAEEDHYITEDEINTLSLIVNQVAIAIHQAKLYEITKMQAEREKISRNIIEILRSTLDKNIIKHLFVKNIGLLFNANRVFYSDYDPKTNMYLPIDKNSEYLSSVEEKSFVDFDFSDESIRGFIQPLLEKRELKILSWDEYISDKPKTDILITRFENANVKSSYNLPVLYQGQIMGYFCIEFTKEICQLSNEDINRIRNICTQAGIALYHADLYLKAEESTRLKSEFIANISNEFKSPLMDIVNLSKTLYNPDIEYNQQLEYLKHINEHGRELLELTDDVITISEIESSAFLLHYEHIDSGQLITDVINAIKSTNGNQDITVNMNLEKININADKAMLTKILHILLSNAIKLTKGKCNILIKSELRDDKLVIAIDDAATREGVDSLIEGIQQEPASHRISQIGGRLGMSIAKKLVELHNGYMQVGSTSNLGSIFEVVLPQAYMGD